MKSTKTNNLAYSCTYTYSHIGVGCTFAPIFFFSVLFIPFFDDCFNEAPSSEACLMCGRKKKYVCVCVGRVTPVNPNCPSHRFMSFSCWWGVRWRAINRFTHMESRYWSCWLCMSTSRSWQHASFDSYESRKLLF